MPKVITDVAIRGEKEYRQAVADINNGLKVLNSEMKLVESQYKTSGDSMEALSAKHDVLGRQISSQQEKVEKLREALRHAAQEYGESDKRTMQWQTSLNNAEAELNRMNGELAANEEAMRKAEKETGIFSGSLADTLGVTKNFGDAVGDAAEKVGVKLPDGIKKGLNGLGEMKTGTALAVAGFGALTAAIVKTEQALISMTKESAGYADEILTLSSQTGLSSKTLQEFQYSSELLDVSLDTLQGSLTKLTRTMGDAKDGNEDLQAAFSNLGVEYKNADGSLRKAEDTFYDLIDALGLIENGTERDKIAMDLLGKSAQDLNPLIDAGTDTMRALAAEADSAGAVLDDLALAKLGAVDDAMVRLDEHKDAIKNNMAAEFAPSLEKSIGKIDEAISKAGKALVDSGAVEAFGSILESSVSLIDPLTSLTTSVLPPLATVLNGVAGAVALIADAADVVIGMLTLDFSKIGVAMGFGQSSGPQSHFQSWRNGGSNMVWNESLGGWSFNAAGTDYWRGGPTWVGENGPELVSLPRGTQILNAQESRQAAGATVWNVTIDAKNVREWNDVIRLAKTAQFRERMEVV